ncbi:MAG: glycosyltransferase family 87 protein [Anaerolineae bacterium]
MANTITPQQPKTPLRQHLLGRLLYSNSRTVRWMRRIAAGLGIALGLAQLKLPIESLLPNWIARRDFLQEYTLARAVVDKIDPYLPTEKLAAHYLGSLFQRVFPHPTPHPPPVGLLLSPLALFDYSTAAAIWFGVELVCLLAAVYLLGRALDVKFSVLDAFGAAALLLVWYPFPLEMAFGQLMVPMLTLLAGSWLALRKDHPMLGGALIGLAILLKPIPWPVLLLFVLWKNWRALAGAVLVILAGYMAAGLVVGWGTLIRYFITVLPLVSRLYRAYVWNISIASIGWRLFDGTGSSVLEGLVAPPVIHCTTAASIVAILLPGLVLLATLVALWKQRSLVVSFGIMMCVSILVSPISWSHYIVLAVIPAAQVAHWLIQHHLPSMETNWALFVAGLLIVDWRRLAIYLAGPRPAVEGGIMVPFGLALLTLMPAVAVAALAGLLLFLVQRDSDSFPQWC